jgi:hypothetical protein
MFDSDDRITYKSFNFELFEFRDRCKRWALHELINCLTILALVLWSGGVGKEFTVAF